MRGLLPLVVAACLACAAVAQISDAANQYPVEAAAASAGQEPLRTKVVFTTRTPEEALLEKLPRANLVVGVVSSPKNAHRRDAIRSTWAQFQSLTDPKLNSLSIEDKEQMVVRFIVGNAADSSVEDALRRESAKYGDIVRVPVREDYFNLTLKTGEFLKYAVNTYNFEYAVKCDDDSFVRIDRMLEELRAHGTERVYMGKIWTGTPVDRRVDRFSVWKDYSPFAAGAGYALSADLVQFIVRNWDRLHKWPMEDVAVGMWVFPLHARRIDHPHFHSLPEGCDKDMIVQNPANVTVMKETFFNVVKGIPCHAKPDPFDPSTKNVTDHVLVQLGIPKPSSDALAPQMLVQQDAPVTMQDMPAMEGEEREVAAESAGDDGMSADAMNNNVASDKAVMTMNRSGATETTESLDTAHKAAEERMNLIM